MIFCPICDEENDPPIEWFWGLIICDNCMVVLDVGACDYWLNDDYEEHPIYEAKSLCLSLLKIKHATTICSSIDIPQK